jgi:chitinase
MTRMRLIVVSCVGLCLFPLVTRADLWRTGYYPGYEQITMAASNVDFTALTHIIHFSVVPKPNGKLDEDLNVIAPVYSADLIARAHAAGVKVLICVGGGKTEPLFQKAANARHLPVFINSLTNFMATRGYDGIDVDWEPLAASDSTLYTNLLAGLRCALDTFPTPKLLTVAASAYPNYGDPLPSEYSLYNNIQSWLDQINIMTYDLSGPYWGWVTWYNSPLYDGGYRFLSSAGHVPSVHGSVANFLAYGIAPSKLGIGIPFYGYVWVGSTNATLPGPTHPRQSWTKPPVALAFSYNDIMAGSYQPILYHWDTNAQAAYLSLSYANPLHNAFVSYDDPHSCQVKVDYARDHHLGGLMIWEIALDHTRGLPDPLLQAIKTAAAVPASAPVLATQNSQPINLSGADITLDSYRLLCNNLSNSLSVFSFATNPPDAAPFPIQNLISLTNAPPIPTNAILRPHSKRYSPVRPYPR